jgi:hypothetical protein
MSRFLRGFQRVAITATFVLLQGVLSVNTMAATVSANENSVLIESVNFEMTIELNNFKYSFRDSNSNVIAPAHNSSGITINGQTVISSTYNSNVSTAADLNFSVTFSDQSSASVHIYPYEKSVRLSVEPDTTASNNITVQVGTVTGPFYGLGDDGTAGNVNGVANKTIGNDGGHDRFISTFSIAPNSSFAQVAIAQLDERYLAASRTTLPHTVTLDGNSTAMSSGNVHSAKNFYYFFGTPKEIYSSFSTAKSDTGFASVRPLYGMFGLGWEAWPFQKYNTDASSVAASVTDFIDHHGYPLSWAVIGSGFWQDGGTTTSFGRFNFTKYPDGNGDNLPDIIATIRDKGAKVMFGLRTSFVDCNGSNDFSGGGVDGGQGACFTPIVEPQEHVTARTNNYFAKMANNVNYESRSNIFPQWDTDFELLDANNANAVDWYKSKTALWGVDGWKEDSMITSGVYHPGAWNAPMKALHDRGDYVMARNAYIASPGSIQRLNDTSGQQVRIPQLVLAYAASGAPNVYTDIIGNHSGSNATYMERHAKLAALTASMSFGANPWSLSTADNIKAAALWHEKYRPYIYSAALKTYTSGYPYTATPLPIAFPDDSETHDLDNSLMWQWLIDESMLATPVFNASNSSGTRDVYLPAGIWIDSNTHTSYQGPGLLKDFDQTGTKMPVFIGGKGIVLNKNATQLNVEIWPIKPNEVTSTEYEYHHYDGQEDGVDKTSLIRLENTGWDPALLTVVDTTTNVVVDDIIIVQTRGGIDFVLTPGHDYTVSGGGTSVAAGGPDHQQLSETAENIALGKPVVVDSIHSAEYSGNNAVDGNFSSDASRWISVNDETLHTIEIDLEATFNVNKIKFWTGFENSGALAQYQLEYWHNNTWVSLVNRSGNTNSSVVEEFSVIPASKIRLSSNEWVKLYDLQVFAIPSSKITDTTATASDELNASYQADNAVDENITDNSSRWISAQSNSQHWLEVNLQIPYYVDKVKFFTGWNGYNTPLSTYALEYWNGSVWVEIVNNNNNDNAVVSESFTRVYTSKIRLLTNEWTKLYEIEFYGSQQNLALDKTVTTSSNYNTNYSGDNAVDGDKNSNSSRWISNEFNGPHSIEVDFLESLSVSQIKFWTGWNGYNLPLSDYSLEYWDGTAWSNIVTTSANESSSVVHDFPTVSASKIKLTSSNWIKLYELEVH